jgi:hypothetical protein
MMRMPKLTAIYAAELRVAQSMQKTQDSLHRVRAAFRATLARPSTLGLVVGAGGLLGFWLARRPQGISPANGVRVATTASAAVLLRALIVRYGMQHLPDIFRQIWAARQNRAA